MRHTLFKILVCICLFFLVIIVLIVSLPSVVTNSVFGLDGSMVDMEKPTTLLESYNDLAADISAVVEEGYDAALAKVEQIIEDGGYDYDLSMDALINYAQGSAGYDVSYILAAYSASLQQRNTGKEDMLAKLRSVADSMFPVSFVEKESEQIVPFTYLLFQFSLFFYDGIKIFRLIGAFLWSDKLCLNDVLYHDFKGLPVFFIHCQEEAGKHNDNHCKCRHACSRAVFEQKEKR